MIFILSSQVGPECPSGQSHLYELESMSVHKPSFLHGFNIEHNFASISHFGPLYIQTYYYFIIACNV